MSVNFNQEHFQILLAIACGVLYYSCISMCYIYLTLYV